MSRQERASRTHKILCITGTSWLVVSMCLMINPWSWDNIKLLFWGFVLLWPVMNSALQQGWQVAKQRSLLQRCGATAVAGLLLFALLWPGVTYHLDLIGRAPSKIAKVAEWQAVCEQVRQLPVNTRLAIAPIQTHPVLLCGQPVVISFPRHIETHGYSPHRAMGILKGVFGQGPLPKGPWTAEIAGLYWGEREKSMVERGYFYGPIGYCGQEMPSQSVEWGRIILLQQR